ncbi:MAG: hypothetical protein COV67_13720 [Nitrospinae bacterium CG11_big_fil_rev_8_21_14_0_20_56_8]|nr:MAG: hypothetical protein COV67_13720 [Nitrospinae bacterium CG11_big_fil_rev_8_21_14_0_20_56_8]
MTRYSFISRFLPILLFLAIVSCTQKESEEYIREGVKFTEEQRYDEAIEAYQRAIERGPKNPKAYYSLGGIYNYKQMLPEAEEAFKKAIFLDPTHHDAHYSLGFTYELMGRKEDAEREYRRAHDLKSKFEGILKKDLENR